jgi:alkanesulfonate monooxygenase SsuD/methylene tetrahydromethanopterin reductase-like flavin-dependent oxidoreductase (luciferase family)
VNNDARRHWAMLVPHVPGHVLAAQAGMIEAAGLGGIAAPEFYGNPLVTLSHCAANTTRVELLSAITLASVHNPFSLAMSAIDLDRLSGGRFILGVGPSLPEMVEGFHGLPESPRPLARLREAIEVIRLVVAKSHTSELGRFQGEFYEHDWTTFQGNPLPPLRPSIPIWIAAARMGLVRLAGAVADGLTSHALWSVEWALREGLPTLTQALKDSGRERTDFHWQAAFFVAVNPDRRQALQDAKPTIAFYAGVDSYEPYFDAHGFGAEARACQQALRCHDLVGAGAAAIRDEMAETFVIAGSADGCRKRLEPLWELADSFMLVPPFQALPPEQVMAYNLSLAEAFYG